MDLDGLERRAFRVVTTVATSGSSEFVKLLLLASRALLLLLLVPSSPSSEDAEVLVIFVMTSVSAPLTALLATVFKASGVRSKFLSDPETLRGSFNLNEDSANSIALGTVWTSIVFSPAAATATPPVSSANASGRFKFIACTNSPLETLASLENIFWTSWSTIGREMVALTA